MGFVVLPALIPDITAVYDAYFAAFAEDPVTRALFPKATKEDLTNSESEFRYVPPFSCIVCGGWTAGDRLQSQDSSGSSGLMPP